MEKTLSDRVKVSSASKRGALAYGALLLCVLGLISVVVASPDNREATEANDQCIMCHIDLFNGGLDQPYLHMPFFERQCIACHLGQGAKSTDMIQPAVAAITGSIVKQEDLWRKLETFRMTTGPAFEQLVKISSLDMRAPYRFRIVVRQLGEKGQGEVQKGPWMGLKADEIDAFGRAGGLDVSAGLPVSLSNTLEAATIYREGNDVFLSWESTRLLYGKVELQEMEGLNLGEPGMGSEASVKHQEDQGEHPDLRDAEELSIEACDECHPASTLGTSHPVRLYGGKDVTIPSELPTLEGMLTCVTCHDPHGAPGKMLVRETIKTKLCVACHYKYKNSSPSTMFD